MSEHLDELLSAYLDDELSAEERARADAHLGTCHECRADLDGLRRVVRRATSLDDRPPEKDLWAGIAARIATPGTSDVVPLESRLRRRFAFTMPQLAAAAVTLMALSAGAVSLLTHQGTAPTVATITPDSGTARVKVVGNPEQQITASYDPAIRELQQSLESRRGQLDTGTVRVIEQSLKVIDFAIRQAREALARDPNNQYLNGHLQRAYGRKLDLLRQAATLTPVS